MQVQQHGGARVYQRGGGEYLRLGLDERLVCKGHTGMGNGTARAAQLEELRHQRQRMGRLDGRTGAVQNPRNRKRDRTPAISTTRQEGKRLRPEPRGRVEKYGPFPPHRSDSTKVLANGPPQQNPAPQPQSPAQTAKTSSSPSPKCSHITQPAAAPCRWVISWDQGP